MVTAFRELQDRKALSPIVITELGMVTDVREKLLSNAPSPIETTVYRDVPSVTSDGIVR